MNCSFCHTPALLYENGASKRPFCSRPCQWLQYHLTGNSIDARTVRDIWEKISRDVTLEQLYRILETNEMMRSVCNSPHFRRMYYERNKDQVVQHLIQELPCFGRTALDWLDFVLRDNSNFQRTNVILYAAHHGLVELLTRYPNLNEVERRMATREALLNGRKEAVRLLWTYDTIPDWAGLAASHSGMLDFLLQELKLSPTLYTNSKK